MHPGPLGFLHELQDMQIRHGQAEDQEGSTILAMESQLLKVLSQLPVDSFRPRILQLNS